MLLYIINESPLKPFSDLRRLFCSLKLEYFSRFSEFEILCKTNFARERSLYVKSNYA